jgi:hypothetical protein
VPLRHTPADRRQAPPLPTPSVPPVAAACRRPGANRTRRAAWPPARSRTSCKTWPAVLLAPGILLPRKITVKTARCARAFRWRCAPVLSVIFPGNILAPIRRTGPEPMTHLDVT